MFKNSLQLFLFSFSLFLSSTVSKAADIKPIPTEQSVNDVIQMKSYERGGIRLFLVDQMEPAARPLKVVVTLPDGGEEFPRFQSYDLGGFCTVDFKKVQISTRMIQSEVWPVQTLLIPVTELSSVSGVCDDRKFLKIEVSLMDDNESWIKASTIPRIVKRR